jgi:hypothetical protein
VGDDGIVVAGELLSPLKALHLLAGAVNTTYLIEDHGQRVRELLALHEAARLDLVRQIATAGLPAMMAMDNLDAAFRGAGGSARPVPAQRTRPGRATPTRRQVQLAPPGSRLPSGGG